MEGELRMILIRTACVTSLAVTAALALGVQAAGASAAENFTTSTLDGPCATYTGPEGQGGAAGINNQICIGAGGAAIGESIGQVATIAGPTISGSAVIGTSIVAAGDAAAVGPV
jgi:hypothetical protein